MRRRLVAGECVWLKVMRSAQNEFDSFRAGNYDGSGECVVKCVNGRKFLRNARICAVCTIAVTRNGNKCSAVGAQQYLSALFICDFS